MIMLFVIWIFTIRVGLGECGGFKTYIRKPLKQDRRRAFLIIYSGFAIFLTFSICSAVYMHKDRNANVKVAEKLLEYN